MNDLGQLELDPVPPPDAEVYRIIIEGSPMPMPRARARIAGSPGGKQWVTFYTPKEAETRKREIGELWIAERLPKSPADAVLGIRCTFAFARPDGHYSASGAIFPRYLKRRPGRGGKNTTGELTGGDVDNCLKLVTDALNEIAWHDDSSIIRWIGEKGYVDQAGVPIPCTIVDVWEL